MAKCHPQMESWQSNLEGLQVADYVIRNNNIILILYHLHHIPVICIQHRLLFVQYYKLECSAACSTCMYKGTGSYLVFSGRGAAGEVTEQAVVGGDSKPSISENCRPYSGCPGLKYGL